MRFIGLRPSFLFIEMLAQKRWLGYTGFYKATTFSILTAYFSVPVIIQTGT
jgi:hypothetical protein